MHKAQEKQELKKEAGLGKRKEQNKIQDNNKKKYRTKQNQTKNIIVVTQKTKQGQRYRQLKEEQIRREYMNRKKAKQSKIKKTKH